MIRTLFLVADSEHAEPLNTAKRYFADHGIAYESHGCGAGNGRFDRERVAGWFKQDWDVVFTHQAHMPTVIEHARCPIIIVERIDGGQLAQGRKWLEHEQALARKRHLRMRMEEMPNARTIPEIMEIYRITREKRSRSARARKSAEKDASQLRKSTLSPRRKKRR